MHFLWQGLVIATLYAGVRLFAKHSSPNLRYLFACVALLAMLAVPIATYSLLGSPEHATIIPRSAAAATRNFDSGTTFAVTTGDNASISTTLAAIWSGRVLPAVVILWIAGALIFWVRLAGGWMAAARLRTQFARTAPSEWQQSLDRLRTRLRVARPVRLLISGLVEVPIVGGWLRPVVLVPIGALSGLPTEHLEALLLHGCNSDRHRFLVRTEELPPNL